MISEEGGSVLLSVTVGNICVGSDGRTCARHYGKRFAEKVAAFAAVEARAMIGGECPRSIFAMSAMARNLATPRSGLPRSSRKTRSGALC